MLSRTLPMHKHKPEYDAQYHTAEHDFDRAIDQAWMRRDEKKEIEGIIQKTGLFIEVLGRFVVNRIRRQLSYPDREFRAQAFLREHNRALAYAKECERTREAHRDKMRAVGSRGVASPEAPAVAAHVPEAGLDAGVCVLERAEQKTEPAVRALLDLVSVDDTHPHGRPTVEAVAEGAVDEAFLDIVRYGTSHTGILVTGRHKRLVVPLEHAAAHVLADDLRDFSDEVEYRQDVYGQRFGR